MTSKATQYIFSNMLSQTFVAITPGARRVLRWGLSLPKNLDVQGSRRKKRAQSCHGSLNLLPFGGRKCLKRASFGSQWRRNQMTWRFHIQTACFIEISMFLSHFHPSFSCFGMVCWLSKWLPGPLIGHRARLEEHELVSNQHRGGERLTCLHCLGPMAEWRDGQKKKVFLESER